MRQISRGIKKPQAFDMLAHAYDCASDVNRNVWEFALNVVTLKLAGISDTELRWLLCRGFVEAAVETTRADSANRSFQKACPLISDQTCFVLSGLGYVLLRESVCDHEDQNVIVPQWDPQLHKLCLCGKVIKHYRSPSPNQETVLAAFQEENWSRRIDDPLPPAPNISARRRVHDTIRNLNRNQLLHFSGDGTGEGVVWDLVPVH
jgi:hypothetical protein